jgi:hypothetical protein
VLPAEAVGIGTLLDGVILERGGYEPAAGNHATLVNLRTGARSEPGIDLAELHVGFRKRYAFDFVYGGVGGEKQVQLGFEGNLEGILEAGTLPTVNVDGFRNKTYCLFLGESRGSRDRDGLRSARGDSFAGEFIGGSKSPSAIDDDADSKADGFGLAQGADPAILSGEVALTDVHNAHIGVGGAAKARNIKGVCAVVPHGLCPGIRRPDEIVDARIKIAWSG